MVGQRRRGLVSSLPPALSFAGSAGGSGPPLRSLSGQGQGPGRSCCSPALSFRPALATFVSWGGWFWFKGSELAQPQTRASSWATLEHAHESALRCEQSNRQGCGTWDGEQRLGGSWAGRGRTHVLAASGGCAITAPAHLRRRVLSPALRSSGRLAPRCSRPRVRRLVGRLPDPSSPVLLPGRTV